MIRDAKARNAPAENSCVAAIAGPYRLPFDRLLEGMGGGSIRAATPQGAIMTSIAKTIRIEPTSKRDRTHELRGGFHFGADRRDQLS
ncbi:hypothetical protein [Bradyrhizobium sp. CCGUVB23]|uniref:hypothetical protein n=1 Tax=Bradyrhizobium sp. CCGUVB23 TaxID=2949630 RepID=UPI0020B1A6D4|nr:hypothetical protein [Bradyrhizobium sp. CCGUVB23]MCP3460916.1 hypothetical protein [Bradyrhizobium sp. CCGUVB23]